MIIEIEENDFREIEDKVGGIRAAAVQARMGTDSERNDHLKNIVAWANEITLFLHKGMVTEVEGNCIRRGFIGEIEPAVPAAERSRLL